MSNNKGYLPHTVIKGFVFWILAICIFTATVAGILQSWGGISGEVAASCLWTVFLLAFGSVAFLVVNYLFGDLGRLLTGEEMPPPTDPGFAERLKKAKAESQLALRKSEPVDEPDRE